MAQGLPQYFPQSVAPIDRDGVTERVVHWIEGLLERGELKAGSRLPPERELAEMLSISRPSLRTALKALSIMGIIQAKPHDGTSIVESLPNVFQRPMRFMMLINRTGVGELSEARRIIEAGLAELAAERASAEDLQALAREIARMRRAISAPEEFLEHDLNFHQAVARAAHNPVMSGVMDSIARMLETSRRQEIGLTRYWKESIEWHQKIYRALRCRDAKAARDSMLSHLRATEQAWAGESRAGHQQKSKRRGWA